jgi:hypothetical protein
MPSTDRELELKAKTSVAQTASQAAVYAKELNKFTCVEAKCFGSGQRAIIRPYTIYKPESEEVL